MTLILISNISRFLMVCSVLLLFSVSSTLLSQEPSREMYVTIFGDGSLWAQNNQSDNFKGLLQRKLEDRGVLVQLTMDTIHGSHSGSRLDDDTVSVAHALDRLTSSLLRKKPGAEEYFLIQLGVNDALESDDEDLFRSRISLANFENNLSYIIDRVIESGRKPVLLTPVSSSKSRSEFEKSQLPKYAEVVRKVSVIHDLPLIDFHTHYHQFLEWDLVSVDNLSQWDRFQSDRIASELASLEKVHELETEHNDFSADYTIPIIDLAHETERQIIVDREKGQYLGHPTTLLLEDNKTMLCVYPKGHGRGGIVYKRSLDSGLTWSDRLPVPENWSTSKEVPTLHRVTDSNGVKRIIMWSGLYPARLAVSENDGADWSPLKIVGDWGGIVVMGCVFAQKSGEGDYMALFHDDGRFLSANGKRSGIFTLLKTYSKDGGMTWSYPERIYQGDHAHLCEPGIIRSPDGKKLIVLLRENSRRMNSHMIISDDEGVNWSQPIQLPASLTGDRHTGVYSSDGRLFISFRDTTRDSPTKGDWVGWVGRFEDILNQNEGQYRVRLMDNHRASDCAYPGVEILPDDTIVTTTYGHWTPGESPYIVSVRLKLSELDRKAKNKDFFTAREAP